MCDNWIGVQFMHHENLILNFQHFHLIDLTEKQNAIWKAVWCYRTKLV